MPTFAVDGQITIVSPATRPSGAFRTKVVSGKREPSSNEEMTAKPKVKTTATSNIKVAPIIAWLIFFIKMDKKPNTLWINNVYIIPRTKKNGKISNNPTILVPTSARRVKLLIRQSVFLLIEDRPAFFCLRALLFRKAGKAPALRPNWPKQ